METKSGIDTDIIVRKGNSIKILGGTPNFLTKILNRRKSINDIGEYFYDRKEAEKVVSILKRYS